MLKVIATPCVAKTLSPGELFSTAGPEYWNKMTPNAVGEKMWMRTDAPATNGHDMELIVYRLTIVRPRIKIPRGSGKKGRDVCEPRHGGEEMSVEAFENSDFSGVRAAVAKLIRESGRDWTAYEVEVEFQITRTGNHTMSSRFKELKDRNLIFPSGAKLPTASGRRAAAYRWRIDSDPGPVGEL